MVCADVLALVVALWSAYALRFSELWPAEYIQNTFPLFLTVPVVGVFIFMRLGLYRAVVRYMGIKAIYAVGRGVLLTALSIYALAYLFQIAPFPRSIPITFALVCFVYVGGSRLLVRSYYHWLINRFLNRQPVLIYGAGGAGVQLLKSFDSSAEYEAIGFIDDDEHVHKSTVAGLNVYSPEDIGALIEESEVKYILLALPGISTDRRRAILEYISQFEVHVKTVPSLPEILEGASVEKLRDVEIEDLLGRDSVEPVKDLLHSSIQGKVVMVTGAGGSIGSELCRQVVAQNPKTIILFEASEYALYTIEQELHYASVDVVPVLGTVTNRQHIEQVLTCFSVDTIYHAAAYKHVPLVEHNVLQGLGNNTFGTYVVAQAAIKAGVERFILISTDKAVRPTNVMGATKRFAELVLQELAKSSTSTIFGMVRFGNVLGSSGSVVPRFKKQILSGGPVTVTHPEITRFFMTIPEAASLVIQAGALAEGGDVFVLDMGESVKIVQLAERMIRLMGLSVKSAENPEGDIEIVYTGLRPGEKLYEELLIGDNVTGTIHPKILRAEEKTLQNNELEPCMKNVQAIIDSGDSQLARTLLGEIVVEYVPSDKNVDWLGSAKKENKVDLAVH